MTRSSPLKIVASLPAALLKGLIQIYRRLISPMLPPRCRYLPTCSEYALEAVEVHGALKGGVLALRRILRCHPIRFLGGSSGFDPVPPAAHIKEKSPDHAQRDCQHGERSLHQGPHEPS